MGGNQDQEFTEMSYVRSVCANLFAEAEFSSGPSPSIERSCPGKPGPAAHTER